jgi:hypothetical protein
MSKAREMIEAEAPEGSDHAALAWAAERVIERLLAREGNCDECPSSMVTVDILRDDRREYTARLDQYVSRWTRFNNNDVRDDKGCVRRAILRGVEAMQIVDAHVAKKFGEGEKC